MIRLALRMLQRDRAKYVGLVFGTAFATLLMAQQLSFLAGVLLRTASQILDVREADLWVMDPRVQYVDGVEPMTDTQLLRVRGVPGVAWALPFYKGEATVKARDGRLQDAILLGVDDATLVGGPTRMVMGSRDDLRKPDAVIIDRASYFAIWPGQKLRLGRELELNDHRAVITAICEASAPFTNSPVLYARYSAAVGYTPQQRKRLSFVVVGVAPATSPHEVALRIAEQTGLKAETWQDFTWDTIVYYIRQTGILVNFGITVALGFTVGAVIVGQTFSIYVIENTRNLGTMKALGLTNAGVARMTLAQGGLSALLGYAIGIGASALFFEGISTFVDDARGLFLPWQVTLIVAAAVLGIVGVTSITSLRRTFRIEPAIVFRSAA